MYSEDPYDTIDLDDEYEDPVSSTTNGHDAVRLITQVDGPCDGPLLEGTSNQVAEWNKCEPAHKRCSQQEDAVCEKDEACLQNCVTRRCKVMRSSF